MTRQSLVEFVCDYNGYGEETAIRYRRGYRMENWSYRRIFKEACRLTREFNARGIAKGDAVLLWGENSPEWIIVFLGCLLRGVVVVPIDQVSTLPFASRIAKEVNAKLIFCSRKIAECGLSLPTIALESLCELIARHGSSLQPSPPLSRQDPLEIIFTSGTTAEPRGVVISHGNVLANIEPLEKEIRKYLRIEKIFHPLRFLNTVPLSHIFGQMMGLFIPPLLKGIVVFIDSLKPSELVDVISRERASVLVAVPRLIESLQREMESWLERKSQMEQFHKDFALAEKERFLWRWWRFRKIHRRFGWKFWAFISGGAALPEQTETFWIRLGYAVIQGYGMTETTSLISLNHPFRSDKGSIGKAFPGMEIRVDEHGEILVRGENLATAYRRGDQLQPVTEADGWFRTGDLAEVDKEGRFYFKGRRKNVIVTPAGMNVYPEDLERELRNQEGVRDCVVIGLERNGNAEPCAVLLLNDQNANPTSIIEKANKSLAEYQQIRYWFSWPEPDFPRTPTQKPLLPSIREVVMSNVGAPAAVAAPNGNPLAGLIARIKGVKGPSLSHASANANLEADLQMTSLDRVELMSALEDRYQVDLSEVRFSEAATIGQIEQLLKQHSPEVVADHAYPHWPQNWLITIIRLAVYYLLSWPATYLLAAPKILGRENLRGVRGPVIVISNHVTYLDIGFILPALPPHLRHRLATATGGERLTVMWHPPQTMSSFKRFLERAGYLLALALFNVFPLPRQSGFLKSFSFAGNLVDRGWNILIFPEGKTTEDGHLLPFRSGIGLLAKQLNIPVVPMRIDGLFELKQSGRRIAFPGRVRVRIGQPVRFSPEQDPNEIARELERIVAML